MGERGIGGADEGVVSTQGKVQKGSEHRSFCPHGARVHNLPSTWMCFTTQKLIKSCPRVFIVFNLQSTPYPLPRGRQVRWKILTL